MPSRRLLIRNATVFDATGAPARPATDVLIDGTSIATVGPSGTVPSPASTETIDATGKFVIPGLIDMHVHVELSGGVSGLAAWLGMGVTTIRDVGGTPGGLIPLREAVARGEVAGPRIFTYGPMLDGLPTIFPSRPGLGTGGDADLTWAIADRSAARAAVDDLLARGVDGVKLYAGLRPELVRAVIECVAGRVPVTGHLSRTWASEAIAAGIDCLEHVHATVYQDVVRPEHRHGREQGNGHIPNYWTWLNTGWAEADLDADYVERFVDQLVRNDVALSPTTVLITGGMATNEALEEPGLRHTPKAMLERRRIQAETIARAREESARAGKPLPPPGAPDPEIGRRARTNQLRFLRKVFEAGGKVVPSTDCGAAPNQVPGFSLHRELALFAEAGIPNAKVLELATRVAADVLGQGASIGTIEPGKRADLLLLEADPLADITNTRLIQRIVKDGVVFDQLPLLEAATL